MGLARLQVVLVLLCQALHLLHGVEVPSLSHSLTTPVVKLEGDDALLTCVVQHQNNLTLMWKKDTSNKLGTKILTANTARITSDERISVIHEDGGQVYVLLIKNLTVRDAGVYICELNSVNVTRSFHELKVLSDKLLAPVVPSDHKEQEASKDSIDVWNYSTERPINHDYSDCCSAKNVSSTCLGFCNIKNILEGSTGTSPTQCEADFPNIVSCMADGRDHLPCCLSQGIPEVCSDLCRGEYTVQQDSIKSLFSCSAYTAPTLACIAVGVETLPKQPVGFSAEAVNDTAIRISWLRTDENEKMTDNYNINITYIQFLSPIFSVKVDAKQAKEFYPPNTKLFKVARGNSEFIVNNLEIFSMYEVSMWSENKYGKSLPTYEVKVVTHLQGESAAVSPSHEDRPQLPDTRACCVGKNVSHAGCLDKFCDPHNVGSVQLTDMMICAPWDSEMFGCLADGRDHSRCCARVGLPPLCQELCTGNVTDINFKYFHCLTYMPQLSGCLLEGYDVLPSSPVNFRFSNLQTNFGILHWDSPEIRGETVEDYLVTFEQLTPEHGKSQSVGHAKSPYILENLESGATYEVYVSGVNSAGVGEPSTRIVFRTASKQIEDLIETSQHPYNQTQCCLNSGIRKECLALCNYDASISQVKSLTSICSSELSKVVRCSAGGRDHLPCCARRGVPAQCQPLCQAVHQQSTGADYQQCLPNIGQIILCYEEGTINLPSPVRNLKAVSISDSSVILTWLPGDKYLNEDPATVFTPSVQFEIYYRKIGINNTGSVVFESDKSLNSTAPVIKINDLTKGEIYSFFVVSRNENGTSLPSSLLTLNISEAAWNGVNIKGAPSPPHLLELESHSATWLKFTWNPPAISHPEDQIKYRLHYRKVSDNLTTFTSVETDVTSIQLHDLSPNTQYSLYMTALVVTNGSKVESTPSETMIAWTDPAFPAFVEAPTIHPIDMVTEGSSMTVLCIAMGTPSPHVTLYLNGHPLRTDVTRHMVTNIHNVTREMQHVSCYADNGYGTPMIASRKITISRPPSIISAAQAGPVVVGDTAIISCKVDGWPAPNLGMFRDKEMRQSIASDGDRMFINAGGLEDDPTVFHLTLKIEKVQMSDKGSYYCFANNSLGLDSRPAVLEVLETPPSVVDVTECCRRHNVSVGCQDVCSFSVDLDLLVARPECLPEFHSVMLCASDGSDHRHCCSTGGVPTGCLDWCRGQPVSDDDSQVCGIEHSETILGCFHSGKDNLPGVPRDVKVRPIDAHSALVFWEAPEKNPHAVDLYRVFWRPVGARGANKSDTIDRKLVLTGLETGTSYEVVVKAGNSNGTSQLTQPLKFLTADQFIIASPAQGTDVGGAIGVAFAVIIVIAMVVLIVYFLKKRNIIVLSVKKPESPTVSFENPFYTVRDQANTNQGEEDYNVHISSSGSWHSEMSSTPSDRSSPSSSSSRGAPDSPATAETEAVNTEVGPTMLEQIQMGFSGQNGFKRFK